MMVNAMNSAAGHNRLVAAALIFCAVATSGPAWSLGGEDLKAAWSGKTFEASLATGMLNQLTFGADGTIKVAGAVEDTGVWRPSSQGYCTKWKVLNGAQERCFVVKAIDGRKFDVRTEQGAPVGTLTMK